MTDTIACAAGRKKIYVSMIMVVEFHSELGDIQLIFTSKQASHFFYFLQGNGLFFTKQFILNKNKI